jgi:succinate dehydrogenase / fumarate reductase, membrane anchor subunit
MSTQESTAERGEARPGGGYDIPKARGRGNFELWSWVFMRVSGVILIFLALYHLIWQNLIIGVEHLDADLVIDRWSNPLFRLLNVALLTFAMLHGLNGARYSIEDYIRRPGLQMGVKVVVYTIVLGSLVFGMFALLTFDPSMLTNR